MSYVTQDKIPEDVCSICTETLKDPLKAVYKLNCGHFFHNNCLNDYCEHSYPDTKCPICRSQLDPVECNNFWAFKMKALNTENLPEEVLDIYNNQEGGKQKRKRRNKTKKQYKCNKKNKSKKHYKYNKKIRKTYKKRYIKYLK